jgi:hypothetical protein
MQAAPRPHRNDHHCIVRLLGIGIGPMAGEAFFWESRNQNADGGIK